MIKIDKIHPSYEEEIKELDPNAAYVCPQADKNEVIRLTHNLNKYGVLVLGHEDVERAKWKACRFSEVRMAHRCNKEILTDMFWINLGIMSQWAHKIKEEEKENTKQSRLSDADLKLIREAVKDILDNSISRLSERRERPTPPVGCVCPVGAEKECKRWDCGRKAWV
jgi:hypothetical protein